MLAIKRYFINSGNIKVLEKVHATVYYPWHLDLSQEVSTWRNPLNNFNKFSVNKVRNVFHFEKIKPAFL